MYEGRSPFRLGPARHVDNPVLSGADVNDIPAEFVADPFLLHRDNTWHMFFEVMDRNTRMGAIGLATSAEGKRWTYRQIVLKEQFHLSYPYVFNWNGEVYMLPETCMARSIRLYKAQEFPTRWSCEGTLLSGEEFCDPSLFSHDGRWWLFAGLGTAPMRADALRLYYATTLTGPWVEHTDSPLIEGDVRAARPAGRVVQVDGKIVRFAQDCYPAYGTCVRAFEITTLTPASYEEHEVEQNPVLAGGTTGWNRSGMHHLDLHRTTTGSWIASVDGWFTPDS